MKRYLVKDLNDPTKTKIEYRTHRGDAICEAPEGEDAEWLDVEDIISEFTNEVIGKRAVVNQAKKDSIMSLRAAAEQSTEYIRLRTAEYPPISDQMDAMYKRDVLGDPTEYDAIAAQITAIKAKYPKPQ